MVSDENESPDLIASRKGEPARSGFGALLRPRSIAIIGATERVGALGRILTENLVGAGFHGRLMPVNPGRTTVLGLRSYADVASLPETPDLAVVATPARSVPAIVRALADRGAGGALIISAGFEDSRESPLRRELLAATRNSEMRIIGPNTLGLIVPGIGLNASFAHMLPAAGGLALVTQSGALLTSVLDWAGARQIGFSHLVSLGDMADVDFGDLLEYLATDPTTSAILLYVEAIPNAPKFMAAARAAAGRKPVFVAKGGRHARSGRVAASHSGRLAGPDAEYSAAFRRAGLVRVDTIEELFDSAETLALAKSPSGRCLAIVSNGGALGVLAVDALFDLGGKLAHLGGETIARLERILPPAWSHANPIDIVGDATPARFEQTLEAVLDDSEVDGVLVLHCPTAVSSGVEAARAVAALVARRPTATVLTSWLGEKSAVEARRALQNAGVPTYETPERAVAAFMRMVQHRHDEQALLGEDSAPAGEVLVNHAAARHVFERVRADGREWLTQPEARDVLAAYGISTVHVVEAATPGEAAQAAATLGGAVVLKIAAPQIVHKSDVEGVVVGLVGEAAVRQAAARMLERVRILRPDADLRGFTIEPMVDRNGGLELIVGVTTGGDFGPVVLFGEGGTAVEAISDTALELPPIGTKLARELVARTRVYRRMRGYRNVPAVDVDAVVNVVVRVSRLLAAFPEVLEMDINPLFATPSGCTALDARIRIALGPQSTWPRFAIA